MAAFLAAMLCVSGLLADAAKADGAGNPLVPIHGGSFESVLPAAPGIKQVRVTDFQLDRTAVTNQQFAEFVRRHPQWQRDRVARIFADSDYLTQWLSATQPGDKILHQPVVRVSWFAASAYCEARGARLPTWHEWEYAAAASETLPDARNDAAWRQRILGWYSQSGRAGLADIGKGRPNFYGIQDLHALVWEWVEDLSAMMVAADNRQQGDPDTLRFCGSGALTMEQKESYATLMRVAMLSSMQASYTGAAMGFRCATGGGNPAP